MISVWLLIPYGVIVILVHDATRRWREDWRKRHLSRGGKAFVDVRRINDHTWELTYYIDGRAHSETVEGNVGDVVASIRTTNTQRKRKP